MYSWKSISVKRYFYIVGTYWNTHIIIFIVILFILTLNKSLKVNLKKNVQQFKWFIKNLFNRNTKVKVKWSRSVMSDSVRPHRWQPTRLPHPWDSPGKNTGVGCHFLRNTKDKLNYTTNVQSVNLNKKANKNIYSKILKIKLLTLNSSIILKVFDAFYFLAFFKSRAE